MNNEPRENVADWFFQECLESGQQSLLIDAIQSGQIGIDERDCIDRTPLMVALEMGRSGLVKTLLGLGANPDTKSDDGGTCLSRAIDAGDAESLALLLDKGADIEARGEMDETPLIEACYVGQAEAVTVLLQRGANRLASDAFGQTAMDIAREYGGPAVLAALANKALGRTKGN